MWLMLLQNGSFMMIKWPALLKLEGDDELCYFDSEQAYVDETKELILSKDDHLIDSNGYVFAVKPGVENRLGLVAMGKIYTLEDITQLIQNHEFNAAQVCITKIAFSSIEQAIASLSYLAEKY